MALLSLLRVDLVHSVQPVESVAQSAPEHSTCVMRYRCFCDYFESNRAHSTPLLQENLENLGHHVPLCTAMGPSLITWQRGTTNVCLLGGEMCMFDFQHVRHENGARATTAES
jgi:hypothetical protein